MHVVLIRTLAVAASANTVVYVQVCFDLLTLLPFVTSTKLNVWAMPGLEKKPA